MVETAEGVGYGAGRSFETDGEGEGMALELDGLRGAPASPKLTSEAGVAGFLRGTASARG